MKIVTVDCNYLFPRFAASYLLIEGKHALVIDNGTSRSVPLILDALGAEGLGPESVELAIVTHVHLDHAGGSSELMRHCPGATLLAHPRAARHLKDPAKLILSAQHVYGEANFEKLYGKIEPIAESRIRALEDGHRLAWHSLELVFLHTRGHANHHFCVLLLEGGEARAIFTGDAFGVCYPDLQNGRVMIFPSTSPTDFDAAEARVSVRRILETGAPVAYPTHFGAVHDMSDATAMLLEELDFSEALLNDAIGCSRPDEQLATFCRERIGAHFPEVFARRGAHWDADAARILKLDMDLNAQGIAYVAVKKRQAVRPA